MWIFIPEYVANAPSVDSFKNRLEKQWSNDEIVYDYKESDWNTRSDHRGKSLRS